MWLHQEFDIIDVEGTVLFILLISFIQIDVRIRGVDGFCIMEMYLCATLSMKVECPYFGECVEADQFIS